MVPRITSLLILAALVVLTQSQVFQWGKCPQYQIAESFVPADYFTGRFYEQQKYWVVFERGLKCIYANYEVMPDGQVKVNNSGVNVNTLERTFAIGEAYCEANRPAACHVRFNPVMPYGDYNVLASEPSKYGLVYSCNEMCYGLFNYQFAWILTREKKASDSDIQAYLQVFESQGIDTSKFLDVDQSCSDD